MKKKGKKKETDNMTLDCIPHDKKENKRKRPAIDNDSDYEDNTSVDCIISEAKSIHTRMSPRSLKRVLERLRPVQKKSIQDMGFGDFLNGNFDFYSTPSLLGMWVVKNFDPNSCTIRMEDGRKIKITRELIHDILGIPMGDIKVKPLKEKNLADDVTTKWRDTVKKIVSKTKICITKLEQHLVASGLSDWEFNLGFLVLFFSIFGLGNKDGTVNERIIPFLPNTDDVSQMDWCSYALESMVRGCKEYTGKCFSGPLLLMTIIYVNSTVSETVKVEKTVPAFKAWNSSNLFKREQEEIELGGFGRLPIVEGLQVIETKKKKTYKKKNLIENRSITEDEDATEDIVDKNEDFTSLDFEVYIARESGQDETDGALGLLNLVPCDMNTYQHQNNTGVTNLQIPENLDIDLHQDNGLTTYDQSIDESEYADSPVSGFSQSVTEFKDINGVDDFSIIVDNVVIDYSEIPKYVQIKYYDLCCSQNMYLHENLLKGLNVKLAVAIILETVTIADAIRACKVTITRDNITTWDKTLKAFEEVGMKVGFLRARISKLTGLSFESNKLLEANKIEQTRSEEEMRVQKEKLCGVLEMIKNLDVEMETLKVKEHKLEQVFHNEANAPW